MCGRASGALWAPRFECWVLHKCAFVWGGSPAGNWFPRIHMCVISHFSHVRLFATLWMWTIAHQALLSMGFFRQEWILEWVAMPSSRASSWPRDWTCISFVSCIGRRVLYHQCHLGSSKDPWSLLSWLFIRCETKALLETPQASINMICSLVYEERV